jgi:hypothetical protein
MDMNIHMVRVNVLLIERSEWVGKGEVNLYL